MPTLPPLMPASMWTGKDIRQFKDNLRKNPNNIIRISSLATATVSRCAAAALRSLLSGDSHALVTGVVVVSVVIGQQWRDGCVLLLVRD